MMKNDVPILFGRFLSPYVRRVGISLNILGISFEHSVISAVDDEEKREAVNPVGRVPALQLENGKILIESSAILDHYDEAVGPARALVPISGERRREALQILAVTTGAIDRSMTANAERRRAVPEPGRIDRLLRQCKQGFELLEQKLKGKDYFDGNSLLQTDITCATAFSFVNHIFPATLPDSDFPTIAALSKNSESMDAFIAARIDTDNK
jgi:glutathione S-transferase